MLTDKDLVKLVQEKSCNESYLQLRERHLALCTNMLKPYWSLLVQMGYSEDEILHERDLAILRAIQRYDFSNGAQVNTWIGGNVRWWCLNILKKFGKETVHKINITADLQIPCRTRFNNDQDISSFINKTLDELGDDNIKLVFKERFVYNNNLKDISRKTGFSTSKVNKMSEVGRKYLKKRIEESENAALSL